MNTCYVVAASVAQYESLKQRLKQVGLKTIRVTEPDCLRGLRLSVLLLLPKATRDWPIRQYEELRVVCKINKITLYQFTETSFKRALEELDEAIHTGSIADLIHDGTWGREGLPNCTAD